MADILGGLRERREKNIAEMHSLLDQAEARGADLDDDVYDSLESDVRAIDERIGQIEDHEKRQAEVDISRHDYNKAVIEVNKKRDGIGISSTPALPSMSEYREGRALAEGTAAAGGYLVPEKQSASFLEYLRKASVVLSAGPRILPMDSDNLHVPKISASVTTAMIAENAAITPSDATFAEVNLVPKNVAAFTLASRQVFDDSTSPAIREVVAMDFMKAIALKLDEQFLIGSGAANNCTGLLNQAGVVTTSLGANGLLVTIDHMADAYARLQASNAGARPVWFLHSRTLATLRKSKDSQNRYLLAADPANDARLQLWGIPIFVTNSLSITTTVGTSSDTSQIILADMEQVLVGERQKVEIAYSEDYAFNAYQIAIRGFARYDIGLANAAGVEVISGVRNV